MVTYYCRLVNVYTYIYTKKNNSTNLNRNMYDLILIVSTNITFNIKSKINSYIINKLFTLKKI